MDGMTAATAEQNDTATIVRRAVQTQHYDTAMRRLRLSMGGLAWTHLLTTQTRHYKTGTKLRTHWCSALVAWMHALDASPWVIPTPDWEAAVQAAYVQADQRDADGEPPVMDASLGAAALADDPRARVVRLATIGEVQAWLQRIGPCVLSGDWTPNMDTVRRDSETIGVYASDEQPYRKAVALVGLKPGAVRLVNNVGPSWGGLGRAWMLDDTLAGVLASGEAWGVVPVDLTAKKGAAK